MNQRAALVELLARVEIDDLWGDASPAARDKALALIQRALPDSNEMPAAVVWAYDGDVSDAIALVEYLTPGAWIKIAGPWLGRWQASVCTSDDPLMFIYDATHPTNPARALLLATLRAKLATMPEGE